MCENRCAAKREQSLCHRLQFGQKCVKFASKIGCLHSKQSKSRQIIELNIEMRRALSNCIQKVNMFIIIPASLFLGVRLTVITNMCK